MTTSAPTNNSIPEEKNNPYTQPDPSPAQVLNLKTADEINKKYHFKTYKDTDEILVYQDGYYQKFGDQVIEKEAVRIIQSCATIHSKSEIKNFIRTFTRTPREEFNKEPHLVNVKNGIYNLLTDEFKPHSPDILSTVQLPIFYKKGADCPAIKAFLKGVVSPEDQIILEEWAGYCLWKEYIYEKALMIYGNQGSGKSIYLGLLREMCGKGNYSAVPLQNIGDRFQTASLFSKSINICGDLSVEEIQLTLKTAFLL